MRKRRKARRSLPKKEGGGASIPRDSFLRMRPAGDERSLAFRLLRRFWRGDRHEGAAALGDPEIHLTADSGENGVIPAHTHARARMKGGAALANHDVAGHDDLAAELLKPEPTARGVTAVAR